MKYLCLAYEEESYFKTLPQDEWLDLRQRTIDYVDSLRTRGILLDARPLQSATRAATVRVRNGETRVTDGPFAETKEQLGGFFLIEAPSLDEALEIAADWPSAAIGTIEVRPLEEELRMDERY
ncbi:MAG TPA: YciI family protein [Rhodothermales bacterium]